MRSMISVVVFSLAAGAATAQDQFVPKFNSTVPDVSKLANQNAAPKMIGTGSSRVPVFDSKHDWKEDDRVEEVLNTLKRGAVIEETWPQLVKHLTDDRYCITYLRLSTVDDVYYNLTVGDVCQQIISQTLATAYYPEFRPSTQEVTQKLRVPIVARDKKELKSWCEKREKQSVYELQVEICKWAILELKNDENFRTLPKLRKQAWIATIEANIELISETRRPCHWLHFELWQHRRITASEAEKIRTQ